VVASNKYISFKGDWRKSGGVYSYMFQSALTATNARCRTSGRFAYAPTNNASAYRDVFNGCTVITSFDDNPFQPITGSPAASMFYQMCYNMSGITNLPAGFMDTSGLAGSPAVDMFVQAFRGMTGLTNLPVNFMNTSGFTGSPAANMFYRACFGMSGVKALPASFMDTRGLTGSPASSMFNDACNGMTGVKTLPDGFMNTSGLSGSPAANMFYRACYNMLGVTNMPAGFLNTTGLSGTPTTGMYELSCYGMSNLIAGDFYISSNITFTSNNIATTLTSAFANMNRWTGTVYWGSSRIYEAITNPATDENVFQNSTNVPGYTSMGGNWK
jgi:hypothetical protein